MPSPASAACWQTLNSVWKVLSWWASLPSCPGCSWGGCAANLRCKHEQFPGSRQSRLYFDRSSVETPQWGVSRTVLSWSASSPSCHGTSQASAHNPFNHLPIRSSAITGLGSLLADLEFGLEGPFLVGLFAILPWTVRGSRRRRAVLSA